MFQRDISQLKELSGKKCLITGHTGFKGSWLTKFLHMQGAELYGYSLEAQPHERLFNESCLSDNINSCFDDIRNKQAVIDFVQKSQPEFIFHLAAQPLVLDSYKDPSYTYETNVLGTLNVLEAVRKTMSVKSVVIVTTDKCYENKEWDYSYRETDHLGGHDPYSSSKACSEILTSSYARSFLADSDVKVITARSGNVIGGGDWAENRIIPDIVKAIQANEKMILRNPTSVRPWLHVLETIHAYCYLAVLSRNEELRRKFKSGDYNISSWNIAPSIENCMNTQVLTEQMYKGYGEEINYAIQQDPHAKHEAGYLTLSNDKITKSLGWNAAWDFKETVLRTSEWYQKYSSKKMSVDDLLKQDVESYISEFYGR